LCGVAQAAGHEGKLEEVKGCSNGGLLDIVGMDGDLVVSSYQVDLGAKAG
jgi:hypothetical protein